MKRITALILVFLLAFNNVAVFAETDLDAEPNYETQEVVSDPETQEEDSVSDTDEDTSQPETQEEDSVSDTDEDTSQPETQGVNPDTVDGQAEKDPVPVVATSQPLDLESYNVTVSFGNLQGMDTVAIYDENGKKVASKNYVDGSASFTLPAGKYEALVKEKTMSERQSFTLSGQTLDHNVNFATKTVVANFAGMKSMDTVAVKTTDGTTIYTKNYLDDSASFEVLKSIEYKILVKEKGMQATKAVIDNVAKFDVKTINVYFNGLTSVDTIQLRTVTQDQDDHEVHTALFTNNYKDNSTSFLVLADSTASYSVLLKEKEMTAENPVENDAVTFTPITISVNLGKGLSSVDTVQLRADGVVLYTKNYVEGTVTFDVLEGPEYTVYVKEKEMDLELDVVKNSVSFETEEITVDFPGLKSVDTVQLRANGKVLYTKNYVDDGTSFKVLSGGDAAYSVLVKEKGMTYTADVVNGNVTVPTKTIVADFEGLKSVDTVQLRVGQDVVYTKNYQDDMTTFLVIDDSNIDYWVYVKEKSMTYLEQVTGAVVVPQDGIGPMQYVNVPVHTITAEFPGVKVDTAKLVFNGEVVATKNYQNGLVSFNVIEKLNEDYQIVLVEDGKEYVYSIRADGDKTVSNSRFDINHSGVYASVVIKDKDGKMVKSWGNSHNSKSLSSIAPGYYDITIKQGNYSRTYENYLILGDHVTLDNTVTTITVNHPGVYASVGVLTEEGSFYTQGNAHDVHTLKILKSDSNVTVKINQNGLVLTRAVSAANDISVDDTVSTIQIDHDKVYASAGAYMAVEEGFKAIVTKGNAHDTHTLKVLKTDKALEIRVNQNGLVYKADVNAKDESHLTDMVSEIVIDHSGVYASAGAYMAVEEGFKAIVTKGNAHNTHNLYVLSVDKDLEVRVNQNGLTLFVNYVVVIN